MAVMGPNGAGKTTLLKILSLLMPPTSGQLRIDGLDALQYPVQCRRQMGVISHNTFLYANLTAMENLIFYGRLYGVPGVARRAAEVLDEVGLSYALADLVRTFSRGMQQRLAIARAILHDPAVLFLDEPYTGLDQHAIDILNGVLARLHNERRTIFLITHSFEQGLNLSDQVAFLHRGRIVFQAATAELGGQDLRQLYRSRVEE